MDGSLTPDPGLWHPYTQRVWKVQREAPPQAPLPWSCLSPGSIPETTCQMMTLSAETVKTTTTRYLNFPPENKQVVFQLSFPVYSLWGAGKSFRSIRSIKPVFLLLFGLYLFCFCFSIFVSRDRIFL